MNEITEMRKAAGLTQVEASEGIGVDRSTVAKWETGDAIPKPDKVPDIARFYRVPLDEAYMRIYGGREGRKQHD